MQRIDLCAREGQLLGPRVLIRFVGHRFLPVWYPCLSVRKTSPPGGTFTHGGSEKCSHGLVNAIFFGPTPQIGKTVSFRGGSCPGSKLAPGARQRRERFSVHSFTSSKTNQCARSRST